MSSGVQSFQANTGVSPKTTTFVQTSKSQLCNRDSAPSRSHLKSVQVPKQNFSSVRKQKKLLQYIRKFDQIAVDTQNYVEQSALNTVKSLDTKQKDVDIISGEIQTVFRVTPYTQETLMKHKNYKEVRILFLDEGNACRSIIAEALTKQILSSLQTPLQVQIHSASIGAPIKDALQHPCLKPVFDTLRIQVPVLRNKIFQEFEDIVEYDLVLVMDRFDYEDVFKEVSIVDVINPGGQFTNKIKCFGEFRFMLQEYIDFDDLESLEITDPFYGSLSKEEQRMKLTSTVNQIERASFGLAAYLLALNNRIQSKAQANVSLQQAMEQSLACPLLSEHAQRILSTSKAQVKEIQTQVNVARKQMKKMSDAQGRTRISQNRQLDSGYWQKLENVEFELRKWMVQHGVRGRMPSQIELRKAGANTLAVSIHKVVGFNAMAARLGLPANSCPNGYWDRPGILEWELAPYLAKAPDGRIYLPSHKFLREHGRQDLIGAIRKNGGYRAVSQQLGVCCRGKYVTVEGLLKEVVFCLKYHGWRQTRLPNAKEFESVGRADIVNGIRKYGGFVKIAQLLQMKYIQRQKKGQKQKPILTL